MSDIDLDDDADDRAIARERAERTMQRRTETCAMHWQLLQAFLGRASSIVRDGRNVRVQFSAEIDAEQFAQFIGRKWGVNG
jgi:hypothetical protein